MTAPHGHGLFETIRVARGRAFRLGDHLARLFAGADALSIARPSFDIVAAVADLLGARAAEPSQICLASLDKSASGSRSVGHCGSTPATPQPEVRSPAVLGRDNGVLKIVLTAGDPPALEPKLSATVSPPRPLPEGARERGVAVDVAADVVAAPSPTSRFKTLARLERDLARRAARARGCFDALLLDASGRVVEGAATNVFFARGGRLLTPDIALGALPGVARAIAIGLAVEAKIPFDAGAFPIAALESADEVFVTNALVGVLPVRAIGDRAVFAAPGPVTAALAARYEALVLAECP